MYGWMKRRHFSAKTVRQVTFNPAACTLPSKAQQGEFNESQTGGYHKSPRPFWIAYTSSHV